MKCLGRNLLVPSGRWKTTGLVASSGGVNRRDAASAASATSPTIASRSWVLANRQPIVCRAASAIRFHLRQVDRFSPTTETTAAPTSLITSNGTSSARSNKGVSFVATVRAHPVASLPAGRHGCATRR